MAHWDFRHKDSTSRWTTPGFFLNVQFGVSFSPTDTPHMASMTFASDTMRENMKRQHQEHRSVQAQGLVPAWQQARLERQQRQRKQQQQSRDSSRQQQQSHRSRRLGIEMPSPRERGRSAPPVGAPTPIVIPQDIISPVSPLSPEYRSSFVSMVTLPMTPASPFVDRPLPPVPSRFRLGEEDMPWSTDPWYCHEEPARQQPSMTSFRSDQTRNRSRMEDPQRRRELEELHLAMMTVDSLDHEGWQRWTWDGTEDIPRPTSRAPMSLGWAVSRTEEIPDLYATDEIDQIEHAGLAPPPYVVSQYENGPGSRRPRSAYT